MSTNAKPSVADVVSFTGCLVVPALAILASVIRAIWIMAFVDQGWQWILRRTGVGAGIGFGVAAMAMFMVQKDTYQRTVNLRTGESTPWRLVSSTLEGPFGQFLAITATGAAIGFLVGVWAGLPAPAGGAARNNAFVAPVEAPREIRPEEAPASGVEGSVPVDVEGGVPGGVVGGVVGALPDAPPARPAVRVGGQVKEPRKLKDVAPIYPDIARRARVQGAVILECTISPQGKVTDVKVLRGIPLLDQAAREAARQWIYTPTLSDGVPVPVIMTVTVDFRLP